MTHKQTTHRNGLEIAIIGMAGRFPGASTVDEFWQNLRNGVESITFNSDQQSKHSDNGTPNNSKYVTAAGLLDGIDMFDASFFGYSPREAEVIDPQQRLFLEIAWEALEAAGWSPSTFKGTVGVFAGVGLGTYLINLYSNPELVVSTGGFQIGIGNDKDHLTTRTSYKLNLQGPSITVQTTCSTSLVAVHLACQALLSGECDMALAGGVTIEVQQKSGYLYQEGGILSPDGHCRAFDADARGTVGGSGVGIVVLRRLEDSLSDGDCIQAVIKGSALNNDGGTKVGYTAPRLEGQSAVIKAAQIVAGVDPETITYVEAHGTGTEIGDPIEVTALTRAFRTKTEKNNFCALGSVKTNIGHLDAAAGVAGLIKTALALKHKEIPPSLHFSKPNPKIDFANSPFFVNSALKGWAANGHPRRAGVSSFGVGGTNAHVVLEEAPAREPSGSSRDLQLLSLSAKTDTALETMTSNMLDYLKSHTEANLADIAFTLHKGRAAFGCRRTVTVRDVDDAIKALGRRDSKDSTLTRSVAVTNRPVIFMFPGQGSQHSNMGLGLYKSEATFREHIDLCAKLLESSLRMDLRDALYPSEGEAELLSNRLTQTEMAQPALFVTEYALARLWMSWGVLPCAMIGHSIGEYVAACLSGVFRLEDALELVAIRGRLMQRLPKGGMLAVPLAIRDVSEALGRELSVAAVNEPSTTVVSGPLDALEDFERRLGEQGLRCRRLDTSHAFHSQMMDPVTTPFAEHVSRVNLKPPKIPFVSNVTGTWIADSEATDPNYWSRQLREPVRFHEGLRLLLEEPDVALLEIGPRRTLGSIARRTHEGAAQPVVVSSMRQPDEKTEDVACLLNSLGTLWSAGAPVDWDGFYARERRNRVQLPTYPFERQRYWIERKMASTEPVTGSGPRAAEAQLSNWIYLPAWKRAVAPTAPPPELSRARSPWLVFVDGNGMSSRIIEGLEVRGHEVFSVTRGAEFRKLGDRAFEISPRSPADYNSLLDELATRGKFPKTIAHIWNVSQESSIQPSFEQFESSQDLGFFSLLFLAQALGKRQSSPINIQVVTSNTLDVTGEELLQPEKTTILGACRVIPQEYPNLTCRSIDITIPDSRKTAYDGITDRLIAEFEAAPSNEAIAYRGNHRLVQIFDAVALESGQEHTPRLREGGVYLIIGGLGWIGLTIAEYLARATRAKLILTGRSRFPEKELWPQTLATHGDGDGLAQKIRRLQAIEELNSEVLVVSADVSDEVQMSNLIAQTIEKFGAVNGVIHAAGFVGDGAACSIQLSGPTQYETHIGAKVKGLYVLERVLRDVEVDFYLLCSSLSSVLGGLGFACYSAANFFMDCFAQCKSREGSEPWISVNWDGWQRASEVEDGIEVGESDDLLLTRGEGIEIFRRILSLSGVNQIAVSKTDLDARIRKWVRLDSMHIEETRKDASLLQHARPNLSTDYFPARNEIERTIAEIWKELLGVSDLGIEDNFFELGGHSLLAIQVVSRLRDVFQAELPIEALFESPTVAELAVTIVQRQMTQADGKDVSEMLAELEQLSEDEALSILMNKAGENG